RKFMRRHWVPLTVTAAILLLTVAGTVAAFLQIRSERNDAIQAQEREEDERKNAQKALADLQQSRKEAEVVWSVIDQAYSSVSDDNIRHLPGLSPVHEELASFRLQGYEKLAKLSPNDPTTLPRLARGHAILGMISAIVGGLQRATTNLEKAAALYEQLERQ